MVNFFGNPSIDEKKLRVINQFKYQTTNEQRRCFCWLARFCPISKFPDKSSAGLTMLIWIYWINGCVYAWCLLTFLWVVWASMTWKIKQRLHQFNKIISFLIYIYPYPFLKVLSDKIHKYFVYWWVSHPRFCRAVVFCA